MALQVNLDVSASTDQNLPADCPSDNCSHQKRDGSILMDLYARDELRVFSQARGAWPQDLPGYAYDSRGGQGITVYIIDSGINPDHEVWPRS